jgi:hypothetical protein
MWHLRILLRRLAALFIVLVWLPYLGSALIFYVIALMFYAITDFIHVIEFHCQLDMANRIRASVGRQINARL